MNMFWSRVAEKWCSNLSGEEIIKIEKTVSESVKADLEQLETMEAKKKIPSLKDSIFADLDDDDDFW